MGVLDACYLGVAERTCILSVLSDRRRKSKTETSIVSNLERSRNFFFPILCYLFGAKDSHLS